MNVPSNSARYLLLLWLCGYTGLCYAAGTLFDEMVAFDWRSVGAAAAAGMFGGLLKTILILSSKNVLVLDVIRQSWRDLLVAMVGGIIIYGLMIVAQMLSIYTVPSLARMLILVGVGFTRGKWQSFVEGIGYAAKKKALSMLSDAPRTEPGPSAVVPLEDSK